MLATHRQGEGLVDVDDRANGTVTAQKRDSFRTKKGHIVKNKRNIWGNKLPHIYATINCYATLTIFVAYNQQKSIQPPPRRRWVRTSGDRQGEGL